MEIESLFGICRQNRKILRNLILKTPPEQLFALPQGFRNNIWWNTAHIVATQQILFYRWSGLPTPVAPEFIDRYKKGTFPDKEATVEEIEELGTLLKDSIHWAEEDYRNGVFEGYNEYTTSTKVTLKNIEDAIAFNVFHEGLHLGVILSQMKLVK